MRSSIHILLPALVWLLTIGADADDRALEGLPKLANTKRAAVLELTAKNAFSFGVFISDDGLALVDLQGLATTQKPTVSLPRGESLKFGAILGVFPEQEVALMKFDHAPKHWLKVASKEPTIGESIALVPLRSDNPWDETIAPVIGPVLAKRSMITPNSLEPLFTKGLSLGSGLSSAQRSALGPGRFAIDRQGRLVAFASGNTLEPRQTLIGLVSIVSLGAQIDRLAKAGKGMAFPLPEGSNPIDPATLDPDFHLMNVAKARQDWTEYRRLCELLMKRHPESRLIERRAAVLAMLPTKGASGEGTDWDSLLTSLKPDRNAPLAQRMMQRSTRAEILTGRSRFEEAIKERQAAIAISPKDYAHDRIWLANLYLNLNRYAEAENHLRELYAFNSDSIMVVEMLELTLLKQGKLEDAEAFTERVEFLEQIYRSR